MSDVTKVFTTSEVADMLEISGSYLLRIAKELNLPTHELRKSGKRNYIFSEEAVKKIQIKLRDIRN